MIKMLQQNTQINERRILRSCVQARAEQDNLNINHPTFVTWTADRMLRPNESTTLFRKYLNNPYVIWRHDRRKMMAITGIILVAKWLAKTYLIAKNNSKQRVASTESLSKETYGHIKSALCDAIKTTVTAAHHFIWRHL